MSNHPDALFGGTEVFDWLGGRKYSTGLVDGSIRLASRTLTHRGALVGGAEVFDWLGGRKYSTGFKDINSPGYSTGFKDINSPGCLGWRSGSIRLAWWTEVFDWLQG